MVIYCAGRTKASQYAAKRLISLGISVVPEPDDSVTHLLLDVPSFGESGLLRSGERLDGILAALPDSMTVCGGNLNHPLLEGYRKMDLLEDASYLAQNAYITAECALDVALPYLDITIKGCPTLIIGWGRIGKCLGQLLRSIGADVTIAARKDSDRAMIRALGMQAVDVNRMDSMDRFRLILNTVPVLVLPKEIMEHCTEDCVKIDLASKTGMEDKDVIIARGLPGIHFPESSGQLIANTLLRLCKEEIL